METKICRRCKVEKNSIAFAKATRSSDGLQSYCVSCQTEYQREYKIKNPGVGTNRHYIRVFGLTLDDVQKLIDKQDGKCCLCGTEIALLLGRGFKNAAHLDHCHNTGKVRGVLCGNCNTALGKLGDTVESIERVLQYVKGTL